MLDQNTDRMWYVIGAIVIGAAIIAMGLNIFDNSFESVEGLMANQMAIANHNIDPDRVGDNLLEPSMVVPNVGAIATVNDLSEIHLESGTNKWGGLRIPTDRFKYEPGTDYVLSYSYELVEGDLLGFGGHINTNKFRLVRPFLNGQSRNNQYVDFDSVFDENSSHNGVNQVEVRFKTANISEEEFLVSRGVWIQPNRGYEENVKVIIRDLKLEKGLSMTK